MQIAVLRADDERLSDDHERRVWASADRLAPERGAGRGGERDDVVRLLGDEDPLPQRGGRPRADVAETLAPDDRAAVGIDGDDLAPLRDGDDAAVDEERRHRHSLIEGELPQQLARRRVERVEMTLRIGVGRDDDALAEEERLAVELRCRAVSARVVAPARRAVRAVERVQRSGAGADEDRVAGDRRRDEHSPLRIETPKRLPRCREKQGRRSRDQATARWAMVFRARKFAPSVPNAAELVSCGAPRKTSASHGISISPKPHSSRSATSSASSRAPAIHPAQRSMLRLAPSGTAFCTTMSPICRRPSSLSTRRISRKTRFLSGASLITPLEMMTSADASGSGMSSMYPRWKSMFVARTSDAAARAASSISGVMSIDTTRPFGPTMREAMRVSIPAPQPSSTIVSPACSEPRANGFPGPARRSIDDSGMPASISSE